MRDPACELLTKYVSSATGRDLGGAEENEATAKQGGCKIEQMRERITARIRGVD